MGILLAVLATTFLLTIMGLRFALTAAWFIFMVVLVWGQM